MINETFYSPESKTIKNIFTTNLDFHLPVDAADFLTVLCRYTSAAQENNFSRLKLHVRLVSLTMKMFRNYRIPFSSEKLVVNAYLMHFATSNRI